MYDGRPGEVAVCASSKLIASSAKLHRQGPLGAAFLYLLEAQTVYLLYGPLAQDFIAQGVGIEIIDVDRGALPVVLPPSDARQAQAWLNETARREPSAIGSGS